MVGWVRKEEEEERRRRRRKGRRGKHSCKVVTTFFEKGIYVQGKQARLQSSMSSFDYKTSILK